MVITFRGTSECLSSPLGSWIHMRLSGIPCIFNNYFHGNACIKSIRIPLLKASRAASYQMAPTAYPLFVNKCPLRCNSGIDYIHTLSHGLLNTAVNLISGNIDCTLCMVVRIGLHTHIWYGWCAIEFMFAPHWLPASWMRFTVSQCAKYSISTITKMGCKYTKEIRMNARRSIHTRILRLSCKTIGE